MILVFKDFRFPPNVSFNPFEFQFQNRNEIVNQYLEFMSIFYFSVYLVKSIVKRTVNDKLINENVSLKKNVECKRQKILSGLYLLNAKFMHKKSLFYTTIICIFRTWKCVSYGFIKYESLKLKCAALADFILSKNYEMLAIF